ncbi:glutaredoxin, partial [archaeon]|nr:glutaredoxin [archaeon]
FEINRDEMDGLMKKTNNWPTAPMIFIDGNFYGGYQDLLKLDNSGKLDEILKK